MASFRSKDANANEIRFVQDQLLKGKAPRYIKWVTKKKRDKAQDRLIVVGDYRIFSIKKTLTGKKKIQRVGHLYDLVEIYSADVDRVLLKFKEFEIDISAQNAGVEVVYIIRGAIQEISFGFADYAQPKLVLMPQDRIPQDLPQFDPGQANGFLATYAAYCDFYKMAPNQEFIKFIKDIADRGCTELALDACPGIERQKEDVINFIPIRAAMRHNTYFTSFSIKNVPRREFALNMADALTHNVTLEKLILSGIDAQDSAGVLLGAALKKNVHNRIIDFDLSRNTGLKEKGILAIADGLQSLAHSLNRLSFALCNLGPKLTGALLQALCFGKDVGFGICELDFSYNKLEGNGSLQLSNYFNSQGRNLRYLLLSNSKVDVGLIMRSIRANGEVSQLQELDLSGNKVDSPAGSVIAQAIETLPSLKILNVARCNMQPQSAVAIVTAVASNTNIQGASINLSENELGPSGASSISQIIINCNNISSLIMRECEFKKEGLAKIADAIGQNGSLRVVDLSMNFRSGSSSKMLRLMNTLATSIGSSQSLVHLSIAGDYGKYSIGKEIEPVLKALERNPMLEELNISGNKIGDSLAVVLCDSLRSNGRLKHLSWDKNNITSGGWQALHNVLTNNRALVDVPHPKHDSERAVKDAKNKEQFKERMEDLRNGIESALKRNSAGVRFTSAIEQAKGRTYSIAVPFQEYDPNMVGDGLAPNSPMMSPVGSPNYRGTGQFQMNPRGSVGYANGGRHQDLFNPPPMNQGFDPTYGTANVNKPPQSQAPQMYPQMSPPISQRSTVQLSPSSPPPPAPPPPPPMGGAKMPYRAASSPSLTKSNGPPSAPPPPPPPSYNKFDYDAASKEGYVEQDFSADVASKQNYTEEYDQEYDDEGYDDTGYEHVEVVL